MVDLHEPRSIIVRRGSHRINPIFHALRFVDDHIAFQRGYFSELSFLRQQGLPLPTA